MTIELQATRMKDRLSIHGFVSGRVQGVYFRRFTRQQALQLGLTGWVRNLNDGRVEFTASGSKAGIKAFLAALATGPAGSSVAQLDSEEIDWQAFSEFDIRSA